jgi:hypothetical protein
MTSLMFSPLFVGYETFVIGTVAMPDEIRCYISVSPRRRAHSGGEWNLRSPLILLIFDVSLDPVCDSADDLPLREPAFAHAY